MVAELDEIFLVHGLWAMTDQFWTEHSLLIGTVHNFDNASSTGEGGRYACPSGRYACQVAVIPAQVAGMPAQVAILLP